MCVLYREVFSVVSFIWRVHFGGSTIYIHIRQMYESSFEHNYYYVIR